MKRTLRHDPGVVRVSIRRDGEFWRATVGERKRQGKRPKLSCTVTNHFAALAVAFAYEGARDMGVAGLYDGDFPRLRA